MIRRHFTASWRPFPLLHTQGQYLKDNSSLLCVAYQLSVLASYGTLLYLFYLYNMCIYIPIRFLQQQHFRKRTKQYKTHRRQCKMSSSKQIYLLRDFAASVYLSEA